MILQYDKRKHFVLNFNNTYLYIMTTMTIQVPDALSRKHDETILLIAAELYEAGKLTLRQDAGEQP